MPVTLDATVTATAGVALVRLRLRNTEPVARRVQVANRLDGRLLPPRRHGRPEPGWSDDGYTGVVDADGARALGYAVDLADGTDSTVAATDDPAELVAVSDPDDDAADPLDAARADLPDARPPADAVVPVARSRAADSAPSSTAPAATEATEAGARETDAAECEARTERTERPDYDDEAAVPPGVRRALDAADRRIGRAETLAEGSVADATGVLADGVDPSGLDALVAADAETLSRVADRAAALAQRAEGVSVPVAALERLA
ncbi:hypothetical protein [Halobaculum marinum]|uniref:DUF8080 domain-containing protein n=1 Tax=Halobaculum marinum TaxID=3031996 RepID=A0ABD5WV13_9EURY|nr:hypothetical protein [Halobaculum sp. DT55]